MEGAKPFMKRILALTRYDTSAASTRQRFVQFEPALRDAGFQLQVRPLFGAGHMDSLVAGRRTSPLEVAQRFLQRLLIFARQPDWDCLWVHYELFPYAPGMLERLAFISGRPVVYDYDDAIFHKYDAHPSAVVRQLFGEKIRPLIADASHVVAGNEYLADYARRWNAKVTVVPTVVDTTHYRSKPGHGAGPPVIGWIGSPSTWQYVRPLLPLLRQLCEQRHARMLVIGAGSAAEDDVFEGLELQPWSEASEIEGIQRMDIGIMPLPDEPWARGKCGYKLLQYMACEVASVGSPVGVNRTIITDGDTGLLATTTDEWSEALGRLLKEPDLRQKLGRAGRASVIADYSLERWAPSLVSIFEQVTAS